jgi:branched-chain amino acid transport system ATP-binding protein
LTTTPPLALELANVTTGYGRTVVLRNLSLRVPAGSIVALIGANGAGKTTLLRVAAGLLPAVEGAVRLGGEEVTRLAPHRRTSRGLCLVPEGRGIFRGLTVAENLLLYTPSPDEARLERALEAFPVLRRKLKQTAGSMSGGEQQMLAVARIHLLQPDVVLLDEVSMGLAPLLVGEIFQVLSELSGSGLSIVLVEQYVPRALEIADRVYMINRGRITFDGSPQELDEERVLQNYLGLQAATPST